jgi:hypothetical protein
MSDPSLEYLLFCNKILTDRTDGRETFVGLFHSLTANRLPFKTDPFQIKFSVKNFRYSAQSPSAVVNIKHPRTGVIVGSAGTLIQIPGLNATGATAPIHLKLGLIMPSLTYTEVGKYEVQLLLGNEPIASRFLGIYPAPK